MLVREQPPVGDIPAGARRDKNRETSSAKGLAERWFFSPLPFVILQKGSAIMNKLAKSVRFVMLGCVLAVAPVSVVEAAPKKSFKVAWSIYVGWMPWGYAADTGIV